jgi:hypothetical protein
MNNSKRAFWLQTEDAIVVLNEIWSEQEDKQRSLSSFCINVRGTDCSVLPYDLVGEKALRDLLHKRHVVFEEGDF